MKKNILIVLIQLFAASFVLGDMSLLVPEYSLSLEECLELGENESLAMLMAVLDQRQANLDTVASWLRYLPELNYSGSAEYEDWTEYEGNVETDGSTTIELNHKISVTQLLFDDEMAGLIREEKNRKVKNDIIIKTAKSGLFHLIRNSYYKTLIYKQQQDSVAQYIKLLESTFKKGNSFYTKFLQHRIRLVINDLEARFLELGNLEKDKKRNLLKILQLPVHSVLRLTTSLESISIDHPADNEKALKNNIILKNLVFSKMRTAGLISDLTAAYLPDLQIEVMSDLPENMYLNSRARFKSSTSGYSASLDSSIEFIGPEYEYINDGWIEASPTPPPYLHVDRKESMFRIVATLDSEKIFAAGNQKKSYKNSIAKQELEIKNKISSILKKLEKIRDELQYYEKSIQNKENKIEILREMIVLLSSDLDVDDFEKLDYYIENLNTAATEIEDIYTEIGFYYNSQISYLNLLESGVLKPVFGDN